jgi:hypothetical protein
LLWADRRQSEMLDALELPRLLGDFKTANMK